MTAKFCLDGLERSSLFLARGNVNTEISLCILAVTHLIRNSARQYLVIAKGHRAWTYVPDPPRRETGLPSGRHCCDGHVD